jgi:hypothetical protein
MWTCEKCGEKIDEQFASCWKCSTPRSETAAVAPEAANDDARKSEQWQMTHRVFRGTFATWEQLFTEAGMFATEIGPERVLSISHSADRSDGVVTVWYWATEAEIASANQVQ